MMRKSRSTPEKIILPILLCLGLSFAAGETPTSAVAAQASPAADSVSADTGAAAGIATDPLLPETLGPGETLLWGRHGLMRAIGAFPLTEESREKELSLRRGMLTAHQIGGFVTLASMIATAYAGQMIINGEEGYEDAKLTLIPITIGTYFTTAALSLLTPPPLVRRQGWSSLSTHKALAWVHFTGMLVTPVLGGMIKEKENYQKFHQIAGYTTIAAFAGAMVVITF